MNLTKKLILVAGVLLIIYTACMGFVIYLSTYNGLLQYTKSMYQQQALSTLQTVDRVLSHEYKNLRVLSRQTYINDILQNPKQELQIQNELDQFIRDSGSWDIVKIASVQGNIILSSDGKNEMLPEEQKAISSASKGSDYISDIQFISKTYGREPTLIFAIPVKENGSVENLPIGVVLGRINWPIVTEILAENPASFVNLYTSLGEEIVDINEKKDIMNYDLNKPIHLNPLIKLTGTESVTSTINSSEHGSFSSLFIKTRESGFLDYKGNNWTLVLEIPTSVVFADLLGVTARLVVAQAIVALIAVIIFILFIQRVFIKRVHKVQKIIDALVADRKAEELIVDSTDELGDLSLSLNRLNKKIQMTNNTQESL